MTENKVNIEETLKAIKRYTNFIEITEKYLKDLKEIECDCYLSYTFGKDFNDRKKYNEQLKKRLICDHENTHEENDYDYHNDIDYIKLVCNDCGFVVKD